ncbi:hypothetical protein IFM89_015941 [Coptis chinensis]|uniref:Uncharacterized protein n=1 Tax=Coptis chinensis TaxID=261450 RepID=A0A835LLP7_9MAGN|nr:hypothetical protein IFM89_015941 [Coptis chinensis]
MERYSGDQHQENESIDQLVITIGRVNPAHLASMEEKILAMPKLLRNSAGQNSCCIFRVPQSLVQINLQAYHPHIISIGPYHYGKEHLNMIQEHKWRFLGSLLSRTRSKGLGLEDYLSAIKQLEGKSRNCYSQILNLSSDELVEMLVLDGCFIVELFRIVGGVVQTDPDDPIFALSWVLSFLLRDLVKLENQIPFFILQALYDLSKMPEEEPGPCLATLALESFKYTVQIPSEVIQQNRSPNGRHLLDLLRSSFIPTTLTAERPTRTDSSTEMIQCVSKLRQAGIKFRVGKSENFLDIKFQHGVLEMPSVTIDDFTTPFFLNCVALEQCYKHCSKHITTYATLMDCLINTPRDVEFLCDNNVIENYFGTNGEVAHIFNILGKDVTFDIHRCYLTGVFDDVNEYYKNNWHMQWASFKYTYFKTPWSFISALAAIILLILTMAQTFYTVYAYYRPP